MRELALRPVSALSRQKARYALYAAAQNDFCFVRWQHRRCRRILHRRCYWRKQQAPQGDERVAVIFAVALVTGGDVERRQGQRRVFGTQRAEEAVHERHVRRRDARRRLLGGSRPHDFAAASHKRLHGVPLRDGYASKHGRAPLVDDEHHAVAAPPAKSTRCSVTSTPQRHSLSAMGRGLTALAASR